MCIIAFYPQTLVISASLRANELISGNQALMLAACLNHMHFDVSPAQLCKYFQSLSTPPAQLC
jgi:hypothetical protein